jgi:hypothetical protein
MISKSKDRQHNSQKKKDHKTKDRVTQTTPQTGVN